jgi:putative endonuclease
MGVEGLAAHYRQGLDGEEAAAAYLRGQGYGIVARNYRFRRAEIDILALKDSVLAVVEVKTRSQGFYEPLSHAVSPAKIRRLVKAADHFVRERGLEVEVRFDIVLLFGQSGGYRLRHLENAFYHF